MLSLEWVLFLVLSLLRSMVINYDEHEELISNHNIDTIHDETQLPMTRQ